MRQRVEAFAQGAEAQQIEDGHLGEIPEVDEPAPVEIPPQPFY